MKDTAKLSSIVLAILAVLGGAGYQPALAQLEGMVTRQVNERVDELEAEVKAQTVKLDTMLQLLTSGAVKVEAPRDDQPSTEAQE